ncbi:hypothetical protein TNCV_2072201 [Trichonephila clavipes]|nr:hypothetical protein TNCV_2072201 [Trichonephila clavipes]
MGRVPLLPQIAFLPCMSYFQEYDKALSPIGRETLGHWSSKSLVKILGCLDGPDDQAIQYLVFLTFTLKKGNQIIQCYSPSVTIGD